MLEYKNSNQFKHDYREYLENNGISSAHIARKIGISPQQLNNMWNKKELTLHDVQRLCTAIGFNCDINIIRMQDWLNYTYYTITCSL